MSTLNPYPKLKTASFFSALMKPMAPLLPLLMLLMAPLLPLLMLLRPQWQPRQLLEKVLQQLNIDMINVRLMKQDLDKSYMDGEPKAMAAIDGE